MCHLSQGFNNSNIEDDEESVCTPPYSPISAASDSDDSGAENSISDWDHDSDIEQSCMTPDSEEQVSGMQGMDGMETDGNSSSTSSTTTWKGFELVGDNIDNTVRPSFQRMERTTQSLHYFHVYAKLDRVDFSGLSDETPSITAIDPLSFLPSDEDLALVKRDMSNLISRYI